MQSKTSDFKWNQLPRRDESHWISPQEQLLSPALTARSQNSTNTKKIVENRFSVMLPYYRGLSEKLQRCLSDHKIKAFFKPMLKIGDKLRNGKDPMHPFDRQGAVYCPPCGDCDHQYFGETKRSFNTCKKEHINFIKHFHPEKNALANHASLETSNELVENSDHCFWELF